MNIKSKLTGIEKRDDNWQALDLGNLDHLNFLTKFSTWLKDWEDSKSKGLSKETFYCLKQTTSPMPDLINYLLTKKDLDYVLTGNLSSDPIEGRFGRYRRSAGTNYFISVRQILEAEVSN